MRCEVAIDLAVTSTPCLARCREQCAACPRLNAGCFPAQVIAVVKNLTKTGITICATIHNPTPFCFNLFDRLMILLHGRVVYSGENGKFPELRILV